MASDGRDRMSEFSEFFLLVGERLVEAAYRLRVEAVKATRIGRVRMEMVMLRRERRSAIFRLGEAAHVAVRDARVADPVLVARAREVDDVQAALDAKAAEVVRIADLPDDVILKRPGAKGAAEEGPTVAGAGDAADGAGGRPAETLPEVRREPVDLSGATEP